MRGICTPLTSRLVCGLGAVIVVSISPSIDSIQSAQQAACRTKYYIDMRYTPRAVLLRIGELAMRWEVLDREKVMEIVLALARWLKVCLPITVVRLRPPPICTCLR